jgi:threonine dehydrogenase-like Zn-dependent dehydrogenase
MRAVTCHEAELEVAELPTPEPGHGQVLLEVTRCGICGSDLHARHHCDELADVLSEAGYDDFMRSDQRVVFGHEFAGEVLDYGPGSRNRLPAGTPVVALPLRRRGPDEIHALGLSAAAPGAYAEQVVVQESLMLPVPNGLPADTAALTEPLAIGWHAVRRSEIKKGTVAVVIGCGPVGLAVIALLKARGVRTIVASDLSPGRRALARACGAHIVVDPAEDSPFTAADEDHVKTIPAAAELAVGTMEKLQRVPVPWHHVWRTVEAFGVEPKRPVIFECVGVPGMIDQIIAAAPLFSRVVVVGVCMGRDELRPSMAINKELDLRFVVGYTPLEFRDTLHMLADGKVRAEPILTGRVGLEGVERAFAALANPESHAKILIDPKSPATEPLEA